MLFYLLLLVASISAGVVIFAMKGKSVSKSDKVCLVVSATVFIASMIWTTILANTTSDEDLDTYAGVLIYVGFVFLVLRYFGIVIWRFSLMGQV